MKLLINKHIQATADLFEHLAGRVNRTISYKTTRKDKGYTCIHSDVHRFVSVMNEMVHNEKLKPRKLKFLDVGAGVGQKVYLAHLMGFDAFGLELRPQLYKEAKEVMYNLRGYGDSQFFNANALTFNKYNEFNVIYFYCPIQDRDLQIQLEKRIAEKASVGTIVVPFLPHHFVAYKENIGELNDQGWKMFQSADTSETYWKRVGVNA